MSDEISFSLNRNQLITLAFSILNVYTRNPIPQFDMTIAIQLLNSMIKFWQYKNKAQIITRRTGYLFLQPTQTSYTLVPGSGDHATYSYVQTSITAANNIGDTTIAVSSVSGINNGDYIGIQGNTTGNLLWYTVSNTSGTTITLSGALTDSTIIGATVFDYTTPMNRPIMVHKAWRTDTVADLDVPLATLSSNDYGDIPLKSNLGIVVGYWYEPQESNGIIHVWNAPQNITDLITISFTHEVDDYDLATDTSDFNSAWYLPIVYGLAATLAPMYGKYQELQVLLPVSQQMYKDMCGADSERGELRVKRY
jgi:hypothetical protein